MVLALVVAATVKVELYAALTGAPVKVTVGWSLVDLQRGKR